MAKLIDGKAVAQVVRNEVARGVAEFRAQHGRAPGLHVILAGDDPASAVYVRNKEKAAVEVGMEGKVHRLPASVSQGALLALVEELNRDVRVDGILVQLPLPQGISAAAVVQAVNVTKDVDGLHTASAGALWSGRTGLVPCTPRGCLRLLEHAGAKLEGARAVVVGRSTLVGKPVAALLLDHNATVTVAHSKSRDLEGICREADVLIAAVGRRGLIRGSFIKPGAFVIDVGTNRDEQGKLCGDVDFAEAENVAGAITPVPGDVGPMTIAMLLDNTLMAAQWRLVPRGLVPTASPPIG